MSEETAPARRLEEVTISDTVNLRGTCRAIYVGGAGDVSVASQDGSPVMFKGVTAGSILPVYTYRINNTGTTATDIVALY